MKHAQHKAHMLALVMLLRGLKGKLLGDVKDRQAKRKAAAAKPKAPAPKEKEEETEGSEEAE